MNGLFVAAASTSTVDPTWPYGDPWPAAPAAPSYALPPIPLNSLQRCPVCEGRGCLPWDPAAPYATVATSTGPWRCPVCEGARVLNSWGSVDPQRVPPPGTYADDAPAK